MATRPSAVARVSGTPPLTTKPLHPVAISTAGGIRGRGGGGGHTARRNEKEEEEEEEVDLERGDRRGHQPLRAMGDDSEDLDPDNGINEDEDDSMASQSVDTDTNASSADLMAHAKQQRLSMLQLERFRRALSRRASGHSKRWSAKTAESDQFDGLCMESSGRPAPRELRIVKYPWAMWSLGGLILLATTVFLFHVHENAVEYERRQLVYPHWWKYIVTVVLYVTGVSVLLHSRVETLVLSRDTRKLSIVSTKPLCPLPSLRRTRHTERELRSITSVRVEVSGEILSQEVDTRLFKVHFDFEDGTSTTALEIRSRKKAMARCLAIQKFLAASGVSQRGVLLTGNGGGAGTTGAGGVGVGAVPAAGVVMPEPASAAAVTPVIVSPPSPTSPTARARQNGSFVASGQTASTRRIMMVEAVPTSALAQKTLDATGT